MADPSVPEGLRMVSRFAVALIAALMLASPAWAVCSSTGIPNCQPCGKAVCLFDGDTSRWVCQADSTRNGATCSDGNACTTGDVCNNGSCVGTPVTCPSDQCNNPGTCNTATGACSSPVPKANNTACNDGSLCTTGDVCTNGVCGGTPVTCPADQCHNAGTCDPSTGVCSNPTKAVGTPCNDGVACTYNDQCNASGQCNGTLITCTSTTCQTLVCQGTSTCLVVSNAAVTVQCNDSNACTSGDHCDGAGTCTGNPILGCTASPDRGCANPNKPLGTACDDLNLCTYGDQCDGAGHCAGTAINPPCSPRGPCETAACNGTSSCSYTLLPADVACPGVDDPCAACDGASNMCRMP